MFSYCWVYKLVCIRDGVNNKKGFSKTFLEFYPNFESTHENEVSGLDIKIDYAGVKARITVRS